MSIAKVDDSQLTDRLPQPPGESVDRRGLIAGVLGAAGVAAVATLARAGPLSPPPGNLPFRQLWSGSSRLGKGPADSGFPSSGKRRGRW